jgi:hypothetical protein
MKSFIFFTIFYLINYSTSISSDRFYDDWHHYNPSKIYEIKQVILDNFCEKFDAHVKNKFDKVFEFDSQFSLLYCKADALDTGKISERLYSLKIYINEEIDKLIHHIVIPYIPSIVIINHRQLSSELVKFTEEFIKKQQTDFQKKYHSIIFPYQKIYDYDQINSMKENIQKSYMENFRLVLDEGLNNYIFNYPLLKYVSEEFQKNQNLFEQKLKQIGNNNESYISEIKKIKSDFQHQISLAELAEEEKKKLIRIKDENEQEKISLVQKISHLESQVECLNKEINGYKLLIDQGQKNLNTYLQRENKKRAEQLAKITNQEKNLVTLEEEKSNFENINKKENINRQEKRNFLDISPEKEQEYLSYLYHTMRKAGINPSEKPSNIITALEIIRKNFEEQY